MGKKVVPEQVEYFCDICAAKISKNHHDDFVLIAQEIERDLSGDAYADYRESYELCNLCTNKFKEWMKEMQK